VSLVVRCASAVRVALPRYHANSTPAGLCQASGRCLGSGRCCRTTPGRRPRAGWHRPNAVDSTDTAEAGYYRRLQRVVACPAEHVGGIGQDAGGQHSDQHVTTSEVGVGGVSYQQR
jgi:hypothetical protein